MARTARIARPTRLLTTFAAMANPAAQSRTLRPNRNAVTSSKGGGTHDGGTTWGVAREGLAASQIIYSVAVDPNDPTRVFIATPDGIFQLVQN